MLQYIDTWLKFILKIRYKDIIINFLDIIINVNDLMKSIWIIKSKRGKWVWVSNYAD